MLGYRGHSSRRGTDCQRRGKRRVILGNSRRGMQPRRRNRVCPSASPAKAYRLWWNPRVSAAPDSSSCGCGSQFLGDGVVRTGVHRRCPHRRSRRECARAFLIGGVQSDFDLLTLGQNDSRSFCRFFSGTVRRRKVGPISSHSSTSVSNAPWGLGLHGVERDFTT
jgi:hypothetical protein